MFLMWFFWLFVLLGGAVMGAAAVRVGLATGFAAGVALNAILWVGCALYAVPRVWRLMRRPAPASAGH